MTRFSPGPSQFSRRSVLRTAAAGAGALTLPGLLAACGKSSDNGSGKQTISLGSNFSDAVPKKGLADAMAAYQTKTGNTVKINTTEHNSYQLNITRYLTGNPDDVVAWFAGYRMQFFAAKGYALDISDLWSGFGGSGFSDALKAASTGADGKQYFIPFYYYPWAVFYRKSLFAAKGYQIPKTWDDFKALAV